MSNLEVRLNLTNFNPHPEDSNYTVFHFFRDDLASEFEMLLKDNQIPYEMATEENTRKIYLFGIHNQYYKKAVKLNYGLYGKYREPFIPNKVFAWSLILIVGVLVVISIIGYLKSNS